MIFKTLFALSFSSAWLVQPTCEAEFELTQGKDADVVFCVSAV